MLAPAIRNTYHVSYSEEDEGKIEHGLLVVAPFSGRCKLDNEFSYSSLHPSRQGYSLGNLCPTGQEDTRHCHWTRTVYSLVVCFETSVQLYIMIRNIVSYLAMQSIMDN
jgi:hypothetical protein